MATVEKRGDSWRLVAYLGYDADGKQIKKTQTIPVTGTSKAAAKRLASAFEADLLKKSKRKNRTNDRNLTFKEFIDYWKKEYALQDDTYSPTTIKRNEILLQRIVPALGHIKLRDLDAGHLMEFYNNLREDGMRMDGRPGKLSPRSIQMHHDLISAILGKAKKWQILTDIPTQYVDAPKAKCAKTPILDEANLIRFIELLFEHGKLKHILFFLIAFSTGLRRGEVAGLRLSDINKDKGKLYVNQTAIVVKGGVKHKEPKTEKSVGSVSVSATIFHVLDLYLAEREQLKQSASDRETPWPDTDLLFVTSEGLPMYPSSFSYWLYKFIERHNLPKITTRSFRNMSITYAIDRGFDLKAVSERARHTQVSTTTDIYAHVLPQKDQAIAATLDEIIQKAKKVEVEFYGDFI